MSRAAIQGVRGSFSHAAAIRALGENVEIVECATFEELLDAVAFERATHGVLPVENTLVGPVQRNVDLLLQHELPVVAEVRVRIELCLIARPDVRLDALTRVASHPVALEQCRGFLGACGSLRAVAAVDTAASVRDLMTRKVDYDAAIASELAAELYGARVLRTALEDDHRNFTRFLLVGRHSTPPPDRYAKTSIAFGTRHRPGALHEALAVLARRGIDLTRLESRPIVGRPWEYRFYADLRGPSAARQLEAVEAMRCVVEEVRVLGQYAEEGLDAS